LIPLREELRRAAPVVVSALSRVARLLWRWVVAGLGVVGAIAIAWLAGRSPGVGVRLSFYMAQAVPRELDFIDLEPFQDGCSGRLRALPRRAETPRATSRRARTTGVVADVPGRLASPDR
jgi:hypothetical protein